MENNNFENENFVVETNSIESTAIKKNGTGKLFVLLISICVVVVGTFFGVKAFGDTSGLFGSKLFASKGQRFMQLLTNDQKVLSSMLAEDNYDSLKTSFRMDIDNIMDQIGEEATGVGALNIVNTTATKKDDFSNSFMMSFNGIKDAKVELQLAKTGNLIGAHMPGVTEMFIGIDLDDLEGLKENLEKIGIDMNFENNDGEKITKEEFEKEIEIFYELLKKYLNVIADEMTEYIVIEKGVELYIDEHEIKADEYKFKLDGESLVKIVLKLEKELLKNKKDINTVVQWGVISDKEEFIELLEEDIELNEEIIEEESYDDVLDEEFLVKVYEKNGKNIATVVETNEVELGMYFIELAKNNEMVIFAAEQDKTKIFLYVDVKKDKDKVTSEFSIKVKDKATEINLDICELEIEKVKTDLIKIDKEDMLLLNTATEDDLIDFTIEVEENLEEFMSSLDLNSAKSELPTIDILPEKEEEEDKKDDNKEDKTEINVAKPSTGKLAEAQKLFDKVEIGMTKEEVIKAIGEPDEEYKDTNSTTLYYKDSSSKKTDLIRIRIKDKKVYTVAI